jgi:hypothetical protein
VQYIPPMSNTKPESLASKWDFYWAAYISALRSESPTRIRAAKAELEEVKREIG